MIPPTEGFPQQVTVNGVRLIDGLGPPRALNLPGHPGWHLEIRQQDNGPLVVHALGDCGKLIISGITDPDFGAFLDGALSQN